MTSKPPRRFSNDILGLWMNTLEPNCPRVVTSTPQQQQINFEEAIRRNTTKKSASALTLRQKKPSITEILRGGLQGKAKTQPVADQRPAIKVARRNAVQFAVNRAQLQEISEERDEETCRDEDPIVLAKDMAPQLKPTSIKKNDPFCLPNMIFFRGKEQQKEKHEKLRQLSEVNLGFLIKENAPRPSTEGLRRNSTAAILSSSSTKHLSIATQENSTLENHMPATTKAKKKLMLDEKMIRQHLVDFRDTSAKLMTNGNSESNQDTSAIPRTNYIRKMSTDSRSITPMSLGSPIHYQTMIPFNKDQTRNTQILRMRM